MNLDTPTLVTIGAGVLLGAAIVWIYRKQSQLDAQVQEHGKKLGQMEEILQQCFKITATHEEILQGRMRHPPPSQPPTHHQPPPSAKRQPPPPVKTPVEEEEEDVDEILEEELGTLPETLKEGKKKSKSKKKE